MGLERQSWAIRRIVVLIPVTPPLSPVARF